MSKTSIALLACLLTACAAESIGSVPEIAETGAAGSSPDVGLAQEALITFPPHPNWCSTPRLCSHVMARNVEQSSSGGFYSAFSGDHMMNMGRVVEFFVTDNASTAVCRWENNHTQVVCRNNGVFSSMVKNCILNRTSGKTYCEMYRASGNGGIERMAGAGWFKHELTYVVELCSDPQPVFRVIRGGNGKLEVCWGH